MNNSEQPDNASTRAKRLAKLEREVALLERKAAVAIVKLDAIEAHIHKLAMQALGDSPDTSRFIDLLKDSYSEDVLDVLMNPKAFLRAEP